MNERIEELFGKALDEAVPGTWITLNPTQLTKLMEKFAELIVQECASMADFADKNPGDYVLKHFGVEE